MTEPIASNLRSSSRKRRHYFRVVFFTLAFAGTLTVWFYRESLRNRLAQAAVLSNDAPPPDLVEESILSAENPRAALLAAWNSGKIVHREVAVGAIRRAFPNDQPLSSELELILLAGALDPDVNVRETALAVLHERKNPASAALAAEQLKDPDQQVRLLGLNYLKDLPRAFRSLPRSWTILTSPCLA